jgi:endonuclease/exonuclease/phosphatase (EEP) superfamily protein YafD
MDSERPAGANPKQLPAHGAGPFRRFLRGVLAVGFNLLLVGLLLAGFARLVSFDWGILELPLVYPPLLVLVVLALVAAVYFFRKRQDLRLGGTVVAGVLAVLSLGWGASPQQPQDSDLVLLALNTHDRPDGAEELARLCADHRVDVLLLQEINPEHREPFLQALPDYQFFWGDQTQFQEYREQTSSITGVKKVHLRGGKVPVETGITGYRTFAVRPLLRGRPIWLVNVHASRPAFFHPRDLLTFFNQFSVHRQEGELLEAWLARHEDLPVLVAGDFNAPRHARNLRPAGMTQAYAAAGSGPHLTFPTALPVIGIDHTLGNRHVAFHSYRTFTTGFSDHKAQLAHFALREGGGG